MEALNNWLLAAVSSDMGLWVLACAAFFDALIVPIPTELLVLATASAYRGTGSPVPALVFLVCTIAFTLGDVATYELGKVVPLYKGNIFRWATGKTVTSWARRALGNRGGLFTIASRFVPAGRTVMNVVAGAYRYPLGSYIPLSAVAAFLWSLYMWTLGYVAAAWFVNNPIAVMVIGFIAAACVGSLSDFLMKIFTQQTTKDS